MFNNEINSNFNYAHGGNDTPRRDNPCSCPQEYAQCKNDTSNCVGWADSPTVWGKCHEVTKGDGSVRVDPAVEVSNHIISARDDVGIVPYDTHTQNYIIPDGRFVNRPYDTHPQNALTSADIISLLPAYELYLIEGERSANTVSKYLRDIRAFAEWQRENAQCKNDTPTVGNAVLGVPTKYEQIINKPRVGTGSDGAVPLCRVATFPPHCGGIFPACPPNPAQTVNGTHTKNSPHAQITNEISNRVGTGLRACPPNPAQIINKPRVGTGSDGAVPLCRVATFPPHCGGIFPACPPNPAQTVNGTHTQNFINFTRDAEDGSPYAWERQISSKSITKSHIIAYKNHLISLYAVASVNSILCSLNSFFGFAGRGDLCVKQVKIQRRIFCDEQKELTQKELSRLLRASVGKQVYYIICTLTLTGIRIGELKYITAGAVENGCAVVNNKGKVRRIYIPKKLQSILREYMKRRKVKTGSVFVTRNGKPVYRSNVWRMMKKLCKKAEVNEEKVFPHNLRHLFARAFYGESKDITRLADILGHSNVNTTRIYTRESGKQHRKTLDLLCRMIF